MRLGLGLIRIGVSVSVRVSVRVKFRVWVRGLPGGRAWRPPDHTPATSLPVPVRGKKNGVRGIRKQTCNRNKERRNEKKNK